MVLKLPRKRQSISLNTYRDSYLQATETFKEFVKYRFKKLHPNDKLKKVQNNKLYEWSGIFSFNHLFLMLGSFWRIYRAARATCSQQQHMVWPFFLHFTLIIFFSCLEMIASILLSPYYHIVIGWAISHHPMGISKFHSKSFLQLVVHKCPLPGGSFEFWILHCFHRSSQKFKANLIPHDITP